MTNFQSPIDFDTTTVVNGMEVAYDNLREIGQGGPLVGTLTINNEEAIGCFYGGPFLYQNGILFVPVYLRASRGWGFKLAKINVITMEVELIGGFKEVIFLDKIDSNYVFYFEDVSKTKYNYYSI